MLTTRILPPEEWARLEGTEAGAAWPTFDPNRVQVLVVERDGVVVGCWCLTLEVHAECLWIAPEHRRVGSVARRLWMGMRDLVRTLGVPYFVTHAVDGEVRALIGRVGGKQIPGDAFVIPVREK